jgi:flagellin-like protein
MPERGVSPVVGVVCLVGITAVLAGVVTVSVLGGVAGGVAPVGPTTGTEGSPVTGAGTGTGTGTGVRTGASFSVTADAAGDVTLVHRGGNSLDPAEIALYVRIGGEPLERQPPVPFFSARGFESAPTGAFNSATTGEWSAGEAASFRIAGTNDPTLRSGATVSVRVSVAGRSVAAVETTV